jgi:Cu(I)/Ag(I) efflux system membrane fusion protein
LRNVGEHLRPGMFATVHLHGAAQGHVLTVPNEAVIKTGTRSVIVVADDATHFRPVLVRIGTEYDGRSEILDGLTVGQAVVASGQFLIDSEANLRGAFEALAGTSATRILKDKSDQMPMPSDGMQ